MPQMTAPSGYSPGTVRLPTSGTNITVGASLISQVPDTNVVEAQSLGFQLHPAETVKVRTMKVPTNALLGTWPQNGTVTSPDGATITVTAGVAPVPMAWVQYYRGLGWTTVEN